MRLSKNDIQRFHSKYEQRKEGVCWEWGGYRMRKGYGQFWVGGAHQLAHRVSYTLSKGQIPDGLFVLHSCHNPSCVNPAHLRTGTPQDNMNDKMQAGNHVATKGEMNGSSKLTEASVRDIRRRYKKGGLTYREIAGEYGAGESTIYNVVNGISWRHVE